MRLHRSFFTASLASLSLLISSSAFAHSHHHSAPALTHVERLALHQQHLHAQNAKHTALQAAMHSGNVVEAAYSLRGTRYAMGGTSRSGFDCSGFVRYILGHAAGVSLPRTAMEQYFHGKPIAKQDLQPGDLVFFKNTYRHGISHVGLYMGNGKFIHAANASKGVRVDLLNSSYYVDHYAGGRRVLPTRRDSELSER